jgi:hypothetical protein
MDPEFAVKLINNYIQFYKNEIENVNIFENINKNDLVSCNKPMNWIYSEMKKYQELDEETKKIVYIVDKNTPLDKYIINKDSQPFATSSSLFSLLLEITSLQDENKDSVYEIKIK